MKSAVVTIKELSFLSGYSISTVSKALNNKKDISSETRSTIQNIAKQHNYIPNNYAVALRNKVSKSIAVIIPKLTEGFYSKALCVLQKEADIKNYRMLFYQSFGCEKKERTYLNSLNDGSIYGIIVISDDDSKINDYANYTMPIEVLNIKSFYTDDQIQLGSVQSLSKLLGA
ncbi:LacI family DNA-binding transcriptional regulator [Winogradskyella sp. PE311]|uniref:LacI family DNA-binding transcriptional regulator n=1 Tax=Winogradskyella sp. PE311 TaxID=3366943 RepID=UPI00397F4B01